MIFIIKTLNQFFFILVIFTLLICIFFIPTNSSNNVINSDGLIWPSPGYTNINSYYGKRNAPTEGASFYHKGIDIGAPEGSKFLAVTDGTITFTDFLGGGGYTITLTDNNGIKYSYCHCNPNFIVSVGDTVFKGDIIGYVGPKYVYGVKRK